MRVWKILREKRGDAFIDVAVILMVVAMVLALTLSVFGVNAKKMSAEDFANYAARQISQDGAFSGDTVKKLVKIAGDGNFSISVKTQDGTYSSTIDSAGESLTPVRIQMGDQFTVTITSVKGNVIGIGGLGGNTALVAATSAGVGEVYWKE